jgi:hypothetical protein
MDCPRRRFGRIHDEAIPQMMRKSLLSCRPDRTALGAWDLIWQRILPERIFLKWT